MQADGSSTDDGALMKAVMKRLPPRGSSCQRKDTGMLIVMSRMSAPGLFVVEAQAAEYACNIGVVDRAADGFSAAFSSANEQSSFSKSQWVRARLFNNSEAGLPGGECTLPADATYRSADAADRIVPAGPAPQGTQQPRHQGTRDLGAAPSRARVCPAAVRTESTGFDSCGGESPAGRGGRRPSRSNSSCTLPCPSIRQWWTTKR